MPAGQSFQCYNERAIKIKYIKTIRAPSAFARARFLRSFVENRLSSPDGYERFVFEIKPGLPVFGQNPSFVNGINGRRKAITRVRGVNQGPIIQGMDRWRHPISNGTESNRGWGARHE